MRFQPWFAWSLAFGCVGWQLVARLGALFSDLTYLSLWSIPAAITGTVAIVGLVVALVPIMLGRGPRHLLVGLMFTMALLPFFVVGAAWPAGPAGLLAAAILLTIRAPWSWLLFGGVIAVDAAAGWEMTGAGWEMTGAVTSAGRVAVTVIVGLALFAVTRLAQLIQAADDTRRQLARAEATAERLRSASRLRTVLGTQLSRLIQHSRAISAATAPSRDDLADLSELAHRAASDARQITTLQTKAGPPQPTQAPIEPAVASLYAFVWWVSFILVVSYSSLAIVNVSWSGRADGVTWAVIVATTVLSSALQLYHGTPRVDGRDPRWWRWTLTAQAGLLAIVTITVGGVELVVLWLLMAGTVVTRVHHSRSWLPMLGILSLFGYYFYLTESEETSWSGLYIGGTLAVAITSVYALCNLPLTAKRLHDSRSDLARTAVATERLRFARDVHDLLGFHLSAVALKVELATRALESDPDETRRQLADVRISAEEALAEIRSIDGIAEGITSQGELAAARALLEAAGVRVSVDAPATPPPGVDHLVGIIVREAATNIVRHAHPQRCVITMAVDLAAVRLRITNDGARRITGIAQPIAGATAERTGATVAGTGIANLTTRAEAIGGELTAMADGDHFTLAARLPHRPEPLTITEGKDLQALRAQLVRPGASSGDDRTSRPAASAGR